MNRFKGLLLILALALAPVPVWAKNGGDDNGGDDGGGAGSLKFDQSDFQVIEGNVVTVITVERSHGESGAVSVHYATSNGTATAGQDYDAASGTLSWAAGDESRKSFTVQIHDDNVAEGPETVRLALSNPTGGAALDSERSSAVLTILASAGGDDNGGDDDGNGNGNGNSPGVIKFDESTFQALEGGVAHIVVERSHGEKGAVSVRYATADGSAHAGDDYTATSGILTWAAGDERNKVIDVPTLDDSAQEGNETVRLTLSAPAGGATIDSVRGTATLNIVDDDGSTTACADDDDTLCLLDDRFQAEVVWRTPQGQIGVGHKVQLTSKSGTFWFFDSQNVEMLIKVLDACQVFGNHWVFFAATTNVDFTVTVTDTRTGVVKQYTNPAGKAASPVQDTFTFPCSR
jgi:ribosomal protein L35AE/L33A